MSAQWESVNQGNPARNFLCCGPVIQTCCCTAATTLIPPPAHKVSALLKNDQVFFFNKSVLNLLEDDSNGTPGDACDPIRIIYSLITSAEHIHKCVCKVPAGTKEESLLISTSLSFARPFFFVLPLKIAHHFWAQEVHLRCVFHLRVGRASELAAPCMDTPHLGCPPTLTLPQRFKKHLPFSLLGTLFHLLGAVSTSLTNKTHQQLWGGNLWLIKCVKINVLSASLATAHFISTHTCLQVPPPPVQAQLPL